MRIQIHKPFVAASIPYLWRRNEEDVTGKSIRGRDPPLLSFTLPLVSLSHALPLHPSSPLSLSASFSCHCIRHHERFTALLLTDLADQTLPQTQTQFGSLRKTMQKMEWDRTKVKRRAQSDCVSLVCVCVCVFLRVCVAWVSGVPLGGVCCERLSEHVMCDRWRTVSILWLAHMREPSHTPTPQTPNV